MPVFARIATADPVEATAITTLDLVLDTSLLSESSSPSSSTASTSTSSPLSVSTTDTDVVCQCTCPSSPTISSDNMLLIDGILNGLQSKSELTTLLESSSSSVLFQGHLVSCPLHCPADVDQPGFAQLKQQALLKQQQLALLQQRLQEQLEEQQRQEEQEKQRREQMVRLQRLRRRDPYEGVRLLPTRCCHLYPGSKFKGKQQSGTNSYDVVVDIKHVNLNDSTLCGYLHIKGLTREYPELTTFFDAEIIGPQYSFLTRKWDATEGTDQEHWALFQQFQGSLYNMEAHQDDLKDGDVVFMRWKEHFLVPDHRVEGITGASFAGFYYICYNKRSGHINGYYYHQSSEKFQQLSLSHVEERKSFGSYEFR
ncbi:vacuolar import and degradation protein-domain-containing protein [Linnemannia elongata]|nr:GID complex subunit 4, VID24 [Linnemannia elongata]KAH7043644.1 vacuolar import and degradation protein-domain-containing protein [Linnemannia elongata]KAK5809141.1 vacuolar import and degradation protein-domain-containing protein [Linnemannia elongata]